MSEQYEAEQINQHYRQHMGHSPSGGALPGTTSPTASLLGQLGGILAGLGGFPGGGLTGQVLTQPQPSVGQYPPYYPSPTPPYIVPPTTMIPSQMAGITQQPTDIHTNKAAIDAINNRLNQLNHEYMLYLGTITQPKPSHLSNAQWNEYIYGYQVVMQRIREEVGRLQNILTMLYR